jgi:tRNA(Ile2) C34 agmatinyltransferase TiaS
MKCPQCSGSMKVGFDGQTHGIFKCIKCGYVVPIGVENNIKRTIDTRRIER